MIKPNFFRAFDLHHSIFMDDDLHLAEFHGPHLFGNDFKPGRYHLACGLFIYFHRVQH